jgi:hypothetical protein
MKPDWDKLMDAFADSKTALVADVDCTAEGEPLCTTHGIRGYPTIKWGDPSALEDYEGGRDFESLKQFADENLKPMCSPSNIDLCDDEKKAEIKMYQDMGVDAISKLIEEKEKEMEDAEKEFENAVQKLQDQYMKLSEAKDTKLEEIKKSGLGLMKAVKASLAKDAKDEL